MTDFVAVNRRIRRSGLTALTCSAIAAAVPAWATGPTPSRTVPTRPDRPQTTPDMPSSTGAPLEAGGQVSAKDPVSSAGSAGQVVITRYKTLHRNLQTGDLDATGDLNTTRDVHLVYTDPATKKRTTLTAQSITYSPATGQSEATGGVRLEREEGTFVGTNLSYNLQQRIGSVTDAILETDYFRMRGKRITARADGTYLVEDGSYTTCIRTKPDYLIRAHRLIVSPGNYVSARGITFYAGGTKLISLPSYRRSLKEGTVSAPIPLPGYNSADGFYVRLRDTPILQRHQTLDFDSHIGVKRLPTGAAAFETDIARSAYNAPPPRTILPVLADPLRGILEQLNPPTYTEYADSQFVDQYVPRSVLTAVLENQQFVYNRRRNDLLVSRFPEIGARFVNLLGNRPLKPNSPPITGLPSNQQPRVVGSTEAVLQRVPNAPFLLNFYAGIGAVHEDPTEVTAGRLATHLSLASQPLIVGKRLSLRLGLTNWFNLYTTGTAYNLVSPEMEMDYVPTRTSRFGIGYRYLKSSGQTPFYFDRRDIRNELRLQYQVGGIWAFGAESKIDLDRSTAYDTQLAVLRNFDCMQVGLAYSFRSQSINIIFNLLPPTSDRSRRLLQPLQPIKTTSALYDAAIRLGAPLEPDLLP